MKTFEFTTKMGTKIEIGIQEEPDIREYINSYIDELKIMSLKVDGVEAPKNPNSGKPFLCKFLYTFEKGMRKDLTIHIQYDVYEFIKKLKNLSQKQDGALILCSQELRNYYENVYAPAAEAKIAQLKSEKAATIQAAFDELTNKTEIDVNYNTSSGYYVSGLAGKHEWFKSFFADMKRVNVKIPDEYITESDWGDYNIRYKYKLPFGGLKKLYQEVQKALEPIMQKEAEEKAARELEEKRREELRASLKCEVLETEKGTQGEGGIDPSALVRLTDPKTGESLKFNCRNIFDFGYVVNPNYPVAEGMEPGGLDSNGYWQNFDANKGGWNNVRELTPFEKRCIEYLHEFPPVYNGIRM